LLRHHPPPNFAQASKKFKRDERVLVPFIIVFAQPLKSIPYVLDFIISPGISDIHYGLGLMSWLLSSPLVSEKKLFLGEVGVGNLSLIVYLGTSLNISSSIRQPDP